MAAGIFQLLRHDGSDWLSSDSNREAFAGEHMTMPALLFFIKGDWAEYAGTLGFANWQDGLRPCFCCNASAESLYNFDNFGPKSCFWRLNGPQDYNVACSRCEVIVTITREQRDELARIQTDDKRESGSHGLVLTNDVPALGLHSGDRLEPGADLHIVGKLKALEVSPVRVTFWRVGNEVGIRHINPLLKRLEA